ncbi:uncharacterized protein [Haliotis asinina]|uniref:uncharacterized protein n=1 Tax=Haliotis asinina TaxID=109174 RepID=UPI0035321E7D
MSDYSSNKSSFSHPSSFSDQSFKVLGGTTLHSSRYSEDSATNDKKWRSTSYQRITRNTPTDSGEPKKGYLSPIFSCRLIQKDIYDAGKVVIYPKCMHRMLSSKYPKILSVLEETYGLGAFIYVGSSFQCFFARHPQRFHKIKTKLICDMCIFPKNKPVILLTVAKDTEQRDHLSNYNLQMKRNLEEWISKTLVEFKALSVVVIPGDFEIGRNFKQKISYAETLMLPTKVLPSTFATTILAMETFLRKLATCTFVHRFYRVSEETLYLDQDLFEEFVELIEEEDIKTVYSECSDYTMLLVCELGYRLALLGRTFIHSKSEEKREFEELRRAQNLSISITYDDGIADENLKVGDVLLSSWKGGAIVFRSEETETAAARRTLASAVVNHCTKVQDEKTRNKLMDLICLHIKRTEEQLENTLHRADSKYQISALESCDLCLRDKETPLYPVRSDLSAIWQMQMASLPENDHVIVLIITHNFCVK